MNFKIVNICIIFSIQDLKDTNVDPNAPDSFKSNMDSKPDSMWKLSYSFTPL
jgi:hypothetical protein